MLHILAASRGIPWLVERLGLHPNAVRRSLGARSYSPLGASATCGPLSGETVAGEPYNVYIEEGQKIRNKWGSESPVQIRAARPS
jgi:hypothetical protein